MVDAPIPTTTTQYQAISMTEKGMAIICLFLAPVALIIAAIYFDYLFPTYPSILLGVCGLPFMVYGTYGLRAKRVFVPFFSRRQKWDGWLKEGDAATTISVRYIIMGTMLTIAFVAASMYMHYSFPPEYYALLATT